MKIRFLARVRFVRIDYSLTQSHIPILGSGTMPSFEASLDITLEGMAGKSFHFSLSNERLN